MSWAVIHIKGAVCKIDPDDLPLIEPYRWRVNGQGYATARHNGKNILMHRLILQPGPGLVSDHINHDKLDNRRENLRAVTPAENRQNSRKFKGVSKFKGVYWDHLSGSWHTQIFRYGRVTNLGRYRHERTAARVYDYAAKMLFRDFAFLNMPDYQHPEQLTLCL